MKPKTECPPPAACGWITGCLQRLRNIPILFRSFNPLPLRRMLSSSLEFKSCKQVQRASPCLGASYDLDETDTLPVLSLQSGCIRGLEFSMSGVNSRIQNVFDLPQELASHHSVCMWISLWQFTAMITRSLILVQIKCQNLQEEVLVHSPAPSTATQYTFVERFWDFLLFLLIFYKGCWFPSVFLHLPGNLSHRQTPFFPVWFNFD